jgi:hypothetical protein
MSLRGAPRILGAQEYTSQLKNRIVAKSGPQPATRRYNYVPTSILANRANQVVKLVSNPEKSCSGGWTVASDCCVTATVPSGQSAQLVADFGEFILDDEENSAMFACAPGIDEEHPPCPQGTIDNLSYLTNQLTLTFAGGDGYEFATTFGILSNEITPSSNVTITIDGTPYTVQFSFEGSAPAAFVTFSAGEITSSSVIVITFDPAISSLISVGLAV